MTAELALAARLQIGLLPTLPGRAPGFRYTHRYVPAEGIGGDIYSVLLLADGSIALMIADVSGHGVTAALISAMVKTFFDSQVRLGGGPLDWANGMNRDLARSTLAEQFATAFIARLDPTRNEICYVTAGHDAPILIKANQPPAALEGRGFMLGIAEEMPFSIHSHPFEPGDRLVLFTDGLVEVEREDRTFLGENGLLEFCASLPDSEETAAGLLLQLVKDHNAPMPFVDDVTLVILDRLAQDIPPGEARDVMPV